MEPSVTSSVLATPPIGFHQNVFPSQALGMVGTEFGIRNAWLRTCYDEPDTIPISTIATTSQRHSAVVLWDLGQTIVTDPAQGASGYGP